MSFSHSIPDTKQDITTDWAPTPISTSFGAREVGWQALGPAIACTTLATGVVTVRWYARCRLTHCLGVDDIIILFSILLAWSMCAIIGAQLNEGLGVYEGGRPVDAEHLAKLIIINNNLWAIAVNVTKASVLAQYLRIFSIRNTRVCCYMLLFSLLPAVGWSVFGGTFLCTPIAKLWKPQLPGECMDARKYWLSAAGINIGIDFMVLLLPLPAITQLHLPRKQKLCLLLMFLLGFFVCVVSVVRLATVCSLERSGKLVESGIQAVTWSAIEVNIGIICASLIALKPVLIRLYPSMFDTTDVPSHCMRLPMAQTSTTEERALCPGSPSTMSPISPVSPSLRLSTTSTIMLQRHSIVAMLPGLPPTERHSVFGVLANSLVPENRHNKECPLHTS